MKTLVIVTCIVEGFHYWKNAPEDVKFLSYPHRHNFLVKLFVQVTNHDREVEFFTLQKSLKDWLSNFFKEVREDSCESIAIKIGEEFGRLYNVIAVEVWEDGENGARVELQELN